MSETCEKCRFGLLCPEIRFRDAPGIIAQHAKVACRRYPQAVEKLVDDWCGEFSPLNPMEAGRGN